MAINATNYDGTKDYKIAEIGDVYHPNLVINGDFQVNQRGASTYTGTASGVYTVDMWRLTNGTLTKPSNGVGVTVTAGSAACTLVQKIPNKYGQTRHTLHTKCANKEYTTSVQGNNTSTVQIADSVGSISLKVDSDYITVTYRINANKTAYIEYCDVFMSQSYLAHVIEDYGTAYQRCLRFFYRCGTGYTRTIGVGYIRNDHNARFAYQYPVMMASVPTITLTGDMQMETEQQGYSTITNKSFLASQVSTERCTITAKPDYDYVVGMNITVYFSDHNLSSYIDASCEPL